MNLLCGVPRVFDGYNSKCARGEFAHVVHAYKYATGVDVHKCIQQLHIQQRRYIIRIEIFVLYEHSWISWYVSDP